MGCEHCLPARAGWIQGFNSRDRKYLWSPCPFCNPNGIQPACAGCDLCKKRKEKGDAA